MENNFANRRASVGNGLAVNKIACENKKDCVILTKGEIIEVLKAMESAKRLLQSKLPKSS